MSEFNLFENSENIIDGTFLLLLVIFGNFLTENLGCQVQNVLHNSMLAKNILILLIIYITINYSDKKKEDPKIKLLKSLGIYVLFLLISRMDLVPTIVVLVLLFIFYFFENYNDYYDTFGKKYETRQKYLTLIRKILLIVIGVIIVVSVLLYYNKQRYEYGKSFNIIKFIFGKIKCKKL
jgi:hypothetical protein